MKEIVSFKAGDLIVKEKTNCTGLYIVKSGQVEVYKLSQDQYTKIPLAVVGPNQYIGEMSVLSGKNHMANAVALTDVEAFKLDIELIRQQIESAPTWLLAMARGLVDRLNYSNDLLRRNKFVDQQLQEKIDAIRDEFIKQPKKQAS